MAEQASGEGKGGKGKGPRVASHTHEDRGGIGSAHKSGPLADRRDKDLGS